MSAAEFLRGVYDQNCTFSETAFYTLELVVPNPVPVEYMTAVLQTKQDRSFMLMSLCGIVTQAATVAVTGLVTPLIELYDPLTGEVFSSAGGQVCELLGGSANMPFTLPEYLVFENARLIGMRVKNEATPNNLAAGDIVSLHLSGIEFGK